MVSRLSCSTTFAGVEVKLTGRQLPRASFLSFLREGLPFALFQSSETSLITMPFATLALQWLPQHPWVHPIRPQGLVPVHISHQVQLQVSFSFPSPILGCPHSVPVLLPGTPAPASISCMLPFNV